MSKPTQTLSVVVPVYANRGTLQELIDRLVVVAEAVEMQHQLIFVDDASPDDSQAYLQACATKDTSILVIHHAHQQGQQQAIRTGLRQAIGEYVVVIDADLQDIPEHIIELYHYQQQHDLDAVFGLRQNRYQSRSRMLQSRVFKAMMRYWLGLPKGAGAFVLMTQNMRKKLIQSPTHGFYLSGYICYIGSSIAGIEAERVERRQGQSAYSSGLRWKTAMDNILSVLELMYVKRFNPA